MQNAATVGVGALDPGADPVRRVACSSWLPSRLSEEGAGAGIINTTNKWSLLRSGVMDIDSLLLLLSRKKSHRRSSNLLVRICEKTGWPASKCDTENH